MIQGTLLPESCNHWHMSRDPYIPYAILYIQGGPHLKMLEFGRNSAENLTLIVVLEFQFNNLLLICLPRISRNYWNTTAKWYFPVMWGKKINIKNLNQNSIKIVKIRASAEFPQNSSILRRDLIEDSPCLLELRLGFFTVFLEFWNHYFWLLSILFF